MNRIGPDDIRYYYAPAVRQRKRIALLFDLMLMSPGVAWIAIMGYGLFEAVTR